MIGIIPIFHNNDKKNKGKKKDLQYQPVLRVQLNLWSKGESNSRDLWLQLGVTYLTSLPFSTWSDSAGKEKHSYKRLHPEGRWRPYIARNDRTPGSSPYPRHRQSRTGWCWAAQRLILQYSSIPKFGVQLLLNALWITVLYYQCTVRSCNAFFATYGVERNNML